MAPVADGQMEKAKGTWLQKLHCCPLAPATTAGVGAACWLMAASTVVRVLASLSSQAGWCSATLGAAACSVLQTAAYGTCNATITETSVFKQDNPVVNSRYACSSVLASAMSSSSCCTWEHVAVE